MTRRVETRKNIPKEAIEENPAIALTRQESETTVKFMLGEIQTITSRWYHADNIAEDRFKSFLTIASGASGVLLLLSQLKVSPDNFLKVSGIVFLLLWLLGLITFSRMLERNKVVVRSIRALNRARRYFFDLDPSLAPYLDTIPSDRKPGFTSFGGRKFGGRTISAFICSLFFGLFCGDVFSLFLAGARLSKLSVVVGGLGFAAHLISLEIFAMKKLKKYEKEYKVHFSDIA